MSTERAEPYAVLGLHAEATPEQVRHAYRGLVRRHHPDTRGAPTTRADACAPVDGATEELERVLAAYAVLGDPARRAAYDLRLAADAQNPRRGSPQGSSRGSAQGSSTPVRVVVRRRPDPLDAPAIRVGPVCWQPVGDRRR
jgi:curved DNA-binding protein CbpA